MRAVVFHRYGPPDVLRLVDRPLPPVGSGQVRVRIHASVATPPDCAFRAADPIIIRLMLGLTRPRHEGMGSTLAGEIDAVGEGVTRWSVGQRVMGASDMTFGTYADFSVLGENAVLAAIPDTHGYAEAAALSEGFLTAMPFLRDEARLSARQSILINGASGSIGTMAVQLAGSAGAHVTGVCSHRNIDLIRSLGADAVIDYGRHDFTRDAGAYDVIFDAVGKSSFARAKRALKPTGIYMTTVPSFGIVIPTLLAGNAGGKRGLLATTGLRADSAKAADLDLLAAMMERGELKAVIDRAYPLEMAAAAHDYVETGRKRGSVVIAVTEKGQPESTLTSGPAKMNARAATP